MAATDANPQRRRGGRPSEGPRREIHLRVGLHLADRIDAQAAAAGLTRTAYLTRTLERAHSDDTPESA